MEKEINLSISDGAEFFAHELGVSFNPTQFIFDFKCITPRIDQRSTKIPLIVFKHNVIMMEHWKIKEVINVLTKSIQDYEKTFGEIMEPDSIKRAKKKMETSKMYKTKEEVPSYLG